MSMFLQYVVKQMMGFLRNIAILVTRGVKLELYATMQTLKAKYHMSGEQVEGSIKTIANMLFGRKWKEYCPNQPIDNKIPPCLSNL